ncbi:hypothetical protein ILUMI_11857 [Ignelater luminosus]|uniref:Gag-pol polyprotein n=1 Tax=Ignelater luminosus TaxID=2038154 RepID=A0A8K0GCV5_IGNLU|nr:hypothetical protein ILUMI_11857 [Ignelater luminosus]
MSENRENKELRQLIRQRVDEVLIELRQHLEKQESLVDEFEKIQAEIEQLNEDDDENMKERQLFEKAYYSSNSSAKCVLSKFSKDDRRAGTYNIYECPEFLKLTPEKRGDKAREHKLCFNCLRGRHFSKQCKSKLCRTCKAKHHTLLHINKNEDTADVAVQGTPLESMQGVALSAHTSYNGKPNRQVLLSTAIVNVIDNRRNVHRCRVILDSASESNIITREMCDLLGLEKSRIEFGIVGNNQEITMATYRANVEIYSRFNSYTTTISCIVLLKISDNIPEIEIDRRT